MKTFGRGMLYTIGIFAVMLVVSVVKGDRVSLPGYIFIPFLIVVWGIAFYQSRSERNRSR